MEQDDPKTYIDSEKSSDVKPNLLTFLKVREVWVNLVVMSLIWMSSSFNSYLVLFQLQFFPGNIYVNTTASACSDILAFATGGYIFTKIGLKLTLNLSFVIAIIGGLAIVIITTV
jgi:hypothetical protein